MTHPQPPVDRRRDPALMARLQAIAAGVFARHGVDMAQARRAGGWTNATWLAGGLALRLAVEPGTEHLRREAALSALLPSGAGCPPVVETGVDGGHEWSLARQMPGRNLGDVWPALNWDSRIVAMQQLWERAEAVHRTDIAAAAAYTPERSPFYAPDPAEAEAALARLRAAGLLAAREAGILRQALDRYWAALPSAPRVLNHGDLCHENALWDDGRVTALLDFEFAQIAPVQLDLNELLKAAYAPPEVADTLPDPGGEGLRRLQAAVSEIGAALLPDRASRDVLFGYAVLLELWALEDGVKHRDGREPIEATQPYRTLHSLAGGDGGYLGTGIMSTWTDEHVNT